MYEYQDPSVIISIFFFFFGSYCRSVVFQSSASPFFLPSFPLPFIRPCFCPLSSRILSSFFLPSFRLLISLSFRLFASSPSSCVLLLLCHSSASPLPAPLTNEYQHAKRASCERLFPRSMVALRSGKGGERTAGTRQQGESLRKEWKQGCMCQAGQEACEQLLTPFRA